jgi:hypothetical protein
MHTPIQLTSSSSNVSAEATSASIRLPVVGHNRSSGKAEQGTKSPALDTIHKMAIEATIPRRLNYRIL